VTIRVVVADDQAMVRAGFRMILEAQGDIVVVGEAGDGVEAVALVREHAPDVVLMDVRMPNKDGLAATRELLGSGSPGAVAGTRVVILTTFDLDEYVYEALRAGASGFLLKDLPRDDLVAAVRVVAAGDALLAPSVTRRLIAEFAARPRVDRRGGADPLTQTEPTAGTGEAVTGPAAAGAPARASAPRELAALTARERDTLAQLARGLSNAEIARELVVTEHTVKSHVASILAKLGLRDRVQAVVLAYESGLAGPASRS
jgi:DNA-binding NarL/FixJ family response regulator